MGTRWVVFIDKLRLAKRCMNMPCYYSRRRCSLDRSDVEHPHTYWFRHCAHANMERPNRIYDEDNLVLPYRPSRGQAFQLFLAPTSAGSPFAFHDGANLIITAPLDFETQATYMLGILARDNGSPPRTTAANITVLVGNAEEAPVYTTLSAFTMNETVTCVHVHKKSVCVCVVCARV